MPSKPKTNRVVLQGKTHEFTIKLQDTQHKWLKERAFWKKSSIAAEIRDLITEKRFFERQAQKVKA